MTTYLLDTSVLVEHERGNDAVTNHLKGLASSGHRLAICEPVAMELIAGAKSGNSRKGSQELVDGLPSVPLSDWTDYRKAGAIFRTLRSQGITVRSLIDCLIAVCALGADDTVLLHIDRDFEAIATVSDLRQERLAVA